MALLRKTHPAGAIRPVEFEAVYKVYMAHRQVGRRQLAFPAWTNRLRMP